MTDEELRLYFSRNLNALMKKEGLNKSDIGRKCEMSSKTVWEYLAGHSVPTLYAFYRICESFNICPMELMKKNNNEDDDFISNDLRSEALLRRRRADPVKDHMYGCHDCVDFRNYTCGKEDICKYATFFGHYQCYGEYVQECKKNDKFIDEMCDRLANASEEDCDAQLY